jgi:hypothetical protein
VFLLSVRFVPKAEAHVAFFSVRYGENRRQKKPTRGDGGLINRVTGLRVLVIIVAYCPASRDAVHELQPVNKKRLGAVRFNTVSSSGQVFKRANALE